MKISSIVIAAIILLVVIISPANSLAKGNSPPLPDLAVTDMSYEAEVELLNGSCTYYTVNFTGVVTNIGERTAPFREQSFSLYYANQSYPNCLVGSSSIYWSKETNPLHPGESYIIEGTFKHILPGNHTIKVILDQSNKTKELNESNNVGILPISVG